MRPGTPILRRPVRGRPPPPHRVDECDHADPARELDGDRAGGRQHRRRLDGHRRHRGPLPQLVHGLVVDAVAGADRSEVMGGGRRLRQRMRSAARLGMKLAPGRRTYLHTWPGSRAYTCPRAWHPPYIAAGRACPPAPCTSHRKLEPHAKVSRHVCMSMIWGFSLLPKLGGEWGTEGRGRGGRGCTRVCARGARGLEGQPDHLPQRMLRVAGGQASLARAPRQPGSVTSDDCATKVAQTCHRGGSGCVPCRWLQQVDRRTGGGIGV